MKRAASSSLEIQDAKNCHLGPNAQICRAVSSQLRHVSVVCPGLSPWCSCAWELFSHNYFNVGGRALPGRGSNWTSNQRHSVHVTFYCTWRPSGLATGLHGQCYWHPLTNCQKNCHRWLHRQPLQLCQIWCTAVHGGLWVNGWNITEFLWLPYGIGQSIIFLSCGLFFFLLTFFFA